MGIIQFHLITLVIASLPRLSLFALSPPTNSVNPLACETDERFFVQAETRDLWIGVCGVDQPQFYISVNKRGEQDSVRLPLQEQRDQVYVAKRLAHYSLGGGIYIYTLTADFLTISYYGRTVLSQKVVSWRDFP